MAMGGAGFPPDGMIALRMPLLLDQWESGKNEWLGGNGLFITVSRAGR